MSKCCLRFELITLYTVSRKLNTVFERRFCYFLSFLGECWAGHEMERRYFEQGKSENCINKCYENCEPHEHLCMGKGLANAIYRIGK